LEIPDYFMLFCRYSDMTELHLKNSFEWSYFLPEPASWRLPLQRTEHMRVSLNGSWTFACHT